MKILYLKFTFVVFSVWLIFYIAVQRPDDYVHIVFCDVGQGDAILITHNDKQLLIDSGPDDKVISCLEQYMPFWDRTIELFVLTHMDADHIGGSSSVLLNYFSDILLKHTSTKKTAVFEALERLTSSNEHVGSVIRPIAGDRLELTELVSATVISPRHTDFVLEEAKEAKTETILSDYLELNWVENGILKSENDLSIALIVDIGEVKVLLSGDIELEGELAIIKSGMTEPINILKVGHHGSKSSSSRQFLSIFRPEVSVISSGKNNQFNHPSTRVTELLRELKIDILRTDTLGNIEFITDGTRYWGPI